VILLVVCLFCVLLLLLLLLLYKVCFVNVCVCVCFCMLESMCLFVYLYGLKWNESFFSFFKHICEQKKILHLHCHFHWYIFTLCISWNEKWVTWNVCNILDCLHLSSLLNYNT
jgi:hypothetical protein